MTKLTALFLISLTTTALSSEPIPFTINTKKWSHVLDDHFISITVNPTDLLQGKVYGLSMNSTMAILKGLAPAYVRIGSADTGKYTFKRNRYPSDVVKPDDEYTVTETHWMVFNEVAKQAGLDVIVCLNSAHRSEGTKKWDTRNSLELISFSDSQGYNLTWQLGYEVQGGDSLSGIQFGKDLNRLRTILNAFPRYQHAKLVGPDIRVIHKKEDIDFWNDVLIEAGPTLDAVTWHPRWPQPSKMKVSDNSDLGYEFPIDYLEWDRAQLSKILQKSIFKNPVWIGETKRESTGTFAEGLIWARRLVLAAKLGVEVVMKQPNLMDVTHPKPEYWIALLHKRLLGKSVLETRSMGNNTDLTVISHCTNPFYWSDKPEKLQDGAVTVYGVNMGGLEQKVQIKGTWSGKSQLLFQYVLTSGSDPDSVFSQMTYLNGEPLMMTDDGMLPDIIPKIKKVERGLYMKLPPYSVGFWVIPEAKVKICQLQQHNMPTINIETLTPANVAKSAPKTLENIRDINQFLVDKLKNPESESEEVPEVKIELASSESSEKDVSLPMKENNLQRVTRRIRQVSGMEELNQQLKTIMQETQQFLSAPGEARPPNLKTPLPKASETMEQRIQGLAQGISDAIKFTNQEQEFKKFLEDSGLKQDFGALIANSKKFKMAGSQEFQPYLNSQNPEGLLDEYEVKDRLRRSISMADEFSEEESIEEEEELSPEPPLKFGKKISLVMKDENEKKNQKQDLVIPHQPDLKGLEEKYKQIVHSKIKDGKRKIDDIKRKIKQEETGIGQKIKPTETKDIQEEIIKKEIELLEKTEETVADILKSQKKRQETFEDIIFDELNDVKGERIRELKEMHKHQRKPENSIVKRQVQTPLSRPLLKTVEYIEKNFNLEPESVRKIKRSLEERMGEFLRNYDTKKSLEIKKQRSPPVKEERKVVLRKSDRKSEQSDRRSEHSESKAKSEKYDSRNEERTVSRERPKEKNIIRKTSTSQTLKTAKKTNEEPMPRSRKSEENKKKYIEDDDDSFEMFNEKKLQEPVKKTTKRRIVEPAEEKKLTKRTKTVKREEDSEEEETEYVSKRVEEKVEEKAKSKKTSEEEKVKAKKTNEEEKKTEEIIEPIRNNKERRENMLHQITLMVDKMNSRENHGDKSRGMNPDEDISEEFESDRRPRNIKRWPRKAELSVELLEEAPEKTNLESGGGESYVTQSPVKPIQTNKLSKLRKHRIRPSRKQKELKKVENEEGEESSLKKRHLALPLVELEKRKLIKPKLRKLNPKFHAHANELHLNDKTESVLEKEEPGMKVVGGVETQPEASRQEIQTLEASKPKEPSLEVSKPEVPTLEVSKPEIPTLEASKPETSTLEASKLETSTLEASKPEIPTLEASKPEVPTLEASKPELPTLEASKPELPTLEASKPEVLAPEASAQNQVSTTLNQNEELKKDLEEIAEEKIFLDQGSGTSNEKSEKNGEGSSELKPIESTPENMSTPTEGFIVVEPTEETGEVSATEEPKTSPDTVEAKLKPDITLDAENKNNENDFNRIKITTLEESPNERKNDLKVAAVDEDTSKEEDHSLEEMLKNLDSSLEKKGFEEDDEDVSKSSYEYVDVKTENVPEVLPLKLEKENSQRKRRATFQTKREEDDDDYSSEERIQKFKQMIYRKSPTKKPLALKNEVRSTSGMGLGADEFLKMAGSTVRVMFDDVIPEAYGQTKNKIQNMGLTQYIKEFGNIVQQMKNLDQIFLNIGEAAVKGYIKGNKAEKGPYIQVISRKKRETLPEESVETETAYDASESEIQIDPVVGLDTVGATTDLYLTMPSDFEKTTEESVVNGRTSTGEESIAAGQYDDWQNSGDIGTTGRNDGEGVHENDKAWGVESTEVKAVSLEKLETKEKPQIVQIKQSVTKKDQDTSTQKTLDPLMSSAIDAASQKADLRSMLDENKLSKKMHTPEDLQEKIFTPWIKTTKDFIRQALTTLKRQRELSEILANDLMTKEITKRAIGKREAGEEEPKLPVYYMVPPKGNKKRETQQEESDAGLIRRLRGLQPGVYVVPTDEMTNIRSEQITNEAKQKSGMPNVVTLNIYYDKKNADASGKSESAGQTSETKISEDPVTYYHNKAWDGVSQYGQSGQYLSVPDVNLPAPVVSTVPMNSALQTQTVFATEPRIAELPSSRLIQYPSPAYHYPPVQKMYPSVVPNPQAVYGPVYYLPQESRYAQPPGTKRQWREFKARTAGIPMASSLGSGWNLQYDIPASLKNSAKSISPSSYNKNYKYLVQDKKRSIGDVRIDPSWSETALPFWKFFSTSEKKNKKVETEIAEKEEVSTESGSSEDVFEENRKRAKAAAENKVKTESVEQEATEEKVPEETAEEEKSRKRRSVSERFEPRKLSKRSNPYVVSFRDHDILPEWFGTYQEIDNALDNFPPHSRRSHIISTPWSDEDEELLNILDADDELSIIDLDGDDYYYSNDNAIVHSRRFPRSTDQSESNLIKSNMIYKMPMDGVHLKPKDLGMAGVKKLTDADSSLEFGAKLKPIEMKMTTAELKKTTEQKTQEPQQLMQTLTQIPTMQSILNKTQPSQNMTSTLPRNPHDDTFYYFFKYAYDSFVKVMKSMTELF